MELRSDVGSANPGLSSLPDRGTNCPSSLALEPSSQSLQVPVVLTSSQSKTKTAILEILYSACLHFAGRYIFFNTTMFPGGSTLRTVNGQRDLPPVPQIQNQPSKLDSSELQIEPPKGHPSPSIIISCTAIQAE